jgi:hypothetical protein
MANDIVRVFCESSGRSDSVRAPRLCFSKTDFTMFQVWEFSRATEINPEFGYG